MILSLRRIFFFLFSFILFFSFFSYSFAQSPNDGVGLTDRKADIRIKVNLESPGSGSPSIVSGTASFFNNSNNTVSNLRTIYILHLLPDDIDLNQFSSSDLIPFDIVSDKKVFSLRGKEEKTFQIEYKIPEGIPSGEYRLEVGLLREGVTEERSRLAQIGFLDGNGGLVLTKGVAMVKDGKEYFNLDGIGYEPEENPVCRVDLENSGSDTVLLSAEVITYLRFIGGDVVDQEKQESLSLDSGARQAIDVLMPSINKPQSYISTIQFTGEDGLISPIVACRWIVRGDSASITLFEFNKNTYKKGDIAQAHVLVNGSADLTAAEDGDHQISILGDIEIKVVITDFDSGNVVGDLVETIGLTSSKDLNLEIPITDDVNHYIATLMLSKDGKVLASEEFENEPPLKQSNNAMYIIIFVAIVLTVLIGIIVSRKKEKEVTIGFDNNANPNV